MGGGVVRSRGGRGLSTMGGCSGGGGGVFAPQGVEWYFTGGIRELFLVP